MKKMLLAGRTRFSSRFLAVLMLHLSFSLAYAREDDFFIKGLISEQQPEMNKKLPEWLKTKPLQLNPALEKLFYQGNKIANGANSVAIQNEIPTGKSVQGRWIFVSFGMPEQELKAAAEEAQSTKSILVFRGVGRDQNTGDITNKLYPIVKDMKPVPGVVIDPTLFTRFMVSAVPTMIETDSEGKTRIARGLPGFKWLSQQEPGDSGQKGPIYDISEPDMIEEMQRRMANFDWSKQKADAIANFWKNQDEFNLPAASKDRERTIDMTIVATSDIFHPDGRLIFRKGEKINPLAMMPMRHAYIIFDATSPKQAEIAKRLGDGLIQKGKPVVYMFSRLNKDRGWDHYNELVNFVNGQVYKLNSSIIDRFKIEALPTVILESDNKIIAREIKSLEIH